MSEPSSQVNTKDVLGVAGSNLGTVNITYISQTQSDTEIHSRKLIPGSPYMGLQKFGSDDKDKFFGRDRWIQELTDHLSEKKVLLLLGASGSGKSSLIQAGLIPALKDQWGSTQLVIFTFTPDKDPFEGFHSPLTQKYGQSKAELAREAHEDTLIKVVESLREKDKQWLIFIDQFEELFISTPEEKQDVFVKSLTRLINKSDSKVKVVMTMRADFLDKLTPYPALGRVHDTYSRMLTDMEDSELKLAMKEPAARNGVTFESGLIDQIISDFKEQSGSLPLLQYTLDALWTKDGIQDRVLNIKTYKTLKGEKGVLQEQANRIYKKLEIKDQQKVANQIFLELIDLAGKEPVSRRVEKNSLEKSTTAEEVLHTLIINRLLVSKKEAGKATVEVAHEELLRSWGVLRRLVEEKEEVIILRKRLYDDADQWNKSRKEDPQKASGDLWSGSKLSRVVEFQQNDILPNLDKIASQFIKASVKKAERQKTEKIRIAWMISAGSLVAVAISSGLGWMAWQKTKQAELNQAESSAHYSLALLNEDKHLDAWIEAIRAGKILQKHNATQPEGLNALQSLLVSGKERHRLEAHKDSVYSVAFSPDGKTLATSSDDRTVKLWNVETGEEIKTLAGHKDSVYSVAFSPNGKTLATGSGDATVKLWNVETGEEIRTLIGHKLGVYSVAFSPDGKTFATGSFDERMKLWNVETGEEIQTLADHDSSVFSVAFSPDGKTLATSSAEGPVKLWNVETGEEIKTLIGHELEVYSVAFSPDGKTLATGSEDTTVKLWNIETGKEIQTLAGTEFLIYSVAFSPDGKTLVTGNADTTVKLWNVETGKEIQTLTGNEFAIYSVAFSPDGKTLATGSGDATVKLWNVENENGEEIQTLADHDSSVLSVAFSPDDKTLATGSAEGPVKLWNVENGSLRQTLADHDSLVFSVAFSSDGKTLATGSDDRTVKLWNVENGSLRQTLADHDGRVNSVAFSSDSKTLATGSNDRTVKLWNVETGKEIQTLADHDSSVLSVAFSPDDKTLATGSAEGPVKLWNVENGSLRQTLADHDGRVNSVAFSSDGKILATGSDDRTVKLWNVENGSLRQTLAGHDGRVNSVAFSSDGKILVTGSGDATVKLWNVETGEEIQTLAGHYDRVYGVAFSPDGKTLATGSEDRTVKLWNLDLLSLDALIANGCDWIHNYLTHNPNVSKSDRKLCE